MRVQFGDVTLDADAMELWRGGEQTPVEPQVFEVLCHLVRHRDRMVPKMELLDEIWGDRFVSESALSSRIKSARQVIGDNGHDQRLIRTVYGRGFRFVGEVVEVGATERTIGEAPPDDELEVFVPRTVLAGSGMAIEVIGAAAAARAAVVDSILYSSERAGLLVGRGGGGGELESFASVLHGLDEWIHRRPELLDDVPPGCSAELTAVLSGSSPTSRQRLFLAARELVAAAARSGGAVLVVEDGHLVDRPTLELLWHLAGATRHLPIALVVTHRPGLALGGAFTATELPGAHPGGGDLVPPALRETLARVAVLGDSCTSAAFEAASGLDASAAGRAVEVALAAGVLERTGSGLRFADAATAAELAATAPGPVREGIHRQVADRLRADGAPPGAVADALMAAGDLQGAGPFQLAAARAAAAVQLHAEVLARTASFAELTDVDLRREMVELRADALAALGEPDAIRCYREALRSAAPDQVPWLRARLARAHIFANDIESAAEVLEGVEPSGGPYDGGIILVSGMVAYLRGDLEGAEAHADEARSMALAPGAPPQMLDVIALQGLIAHSRGEWFDRLRHELRVTADSSELAATVFDSHVCVAQYLLYGPAGREEIIALADDLRTAAESIGSRRAAGFAQTLAGEARLLAGDLAGARTCLEASVALHRAIGSDTGLAHALQRLAEVELNDGNRLLAERLCREALPLARWSPLAQHLMQRTYGTLIGAAPTSEEAVLVVEEALATLDGPVSCEFCEVMVAVPATIALAEAGRLDEARVQLERAERCIQRWEGTAWPAAAAEAAAALARAEGREADATALLEQAIKGFVAANQPLDVARCRESL